ncbi:MAG: DUF6057 family protein [Parabacteroides sp.]
MKHKQFFIGLFLWIVCYLLLEATGKYHFYYVEQFQLFRLAPDYFQDKFLQVGGLAYLLGEFITQFFRLPHVGAALTSLLLTIVALRTRNLMHCLTDRGELFLLYLLPAICLLFNQYDYNEYLSGTVAYVIAIGALLEWERITLLQTPLLTGLLSLLLYGLIGPASFLFSLALCVIGPVTASRGLLCGVVSLVVSALATASSVWFCWVSDYRFAFLPDAYYHPKLEPAAIVYAAWWMLPLVLLITLALKRIPMHARRGVRIIGYVLQTVLVGAILYKGLPLYVDAKNYLMKELDYYTRTEQWDRLVNRLSKQPIKNFLYLNYLNLALMEKGSLCTDMFAYNQRGPQSLLVPWNKSAQVSILSSDIYYLIGEIGLSQQMAFEALIGAENPRNYQRLIQTNLIYGQYKVAEKYIRRLEESLFYRDWARQYKQFLYRDDRVEADPLLGTKRRGLPAENSLSRLQDVQSDLLARAERLPDHKTILEFAGANLLLAKNLSSFEAILQQYYGTPVLPSLPRAFQEAVVILAESDPALATRYAIPEALLQRFAEFKQVYLQNKNHPQLPLLIRKTFGSNYWTYYLFTNI